MANLNPQEKASKARLKEVRAAIDAHIAQEAGREVAYHRSLQPFASPPREFVHFNPLEGEDPMEAVAAYSDIQEIYLLSAKMHLLELCGDKEQQYPLVEVPYQNGMTALKTPELLKSKENQQRFLRFVENDALGDVTVSMLEQDKQIGQEASKSPKIKF